MKLLKRIALVILGVLVISMTACEKDNDVNDQGLGLGQGQGQEPGSTTTVSKKISKVYYSYESTNYQQEKTLVEVWEWNNNNFVDYINQYDGDQLEFMVSFTYDDKNRPSRVDCYRYNLYLNYYYNESDNMPNKLELFESNQMLGTCEIISNNGKMERLNVTIYDNKKAAMLNPLSMLLPKPFASRLAAFENHIAERNGNSAETYNIQLTWSNNNISKIIAQGQGDIITITAQYDNKKCPVYAFLLGIPGGGGLIKNNPTSITAIMNSYNPETIIIDYQYDASGYPIKATEYDADYQSHKEMLYFEYL